MAIVPVGQVTQPVVLEIGVEVTVLNGITLADTTKSQQFVIPLRGRGGDRTITFQAIKTGVTVFTADLEISSDGGTTFNPLAAGIDFNAAAIKQVSQVGAGPIFRLNPKSFTGTSATVNVSVN